MDAQGNSKFFFQLYFITILKSAKPPFLQKKILNSFQQLFLFTKARIANFSSKTHALTAGGPYGVQVLKVPSNFPQLIHLWCGLLLLSFLHSLPSAFSTHNSTFRISQKDTSENKTCHNTPPKPFSPLTAANIIPYVYNC
jgi:hypothetical protein